MAPGAWIDLSPSDEDWLLALAQEALELAVRHRRRPVLDAAPPHERLLAHRACFVTLEKSGRLRGCIGSLQADRPLHRQVADRAWSAALEDPRFPPVDASELALIDISLSILDRPRPRMAGSVAELLALLRPGHDGLILREGRRQSTFLPSVWEQLPQPDDFVAQLQRKGGWAPGHWSAAMEVFTYEAHHIAAKSGNPS